MCPSNNATLMPRWNDGHSVPFHVDEGKSVTLQGDERNQTRWCVKPSGNDALAFKSQQEGRSRFANDMSKETHDGDPLAIKAERPSTTRDLAALGLTSLKCTGRSQVDWLI